MASHIKILEATLPEDRDEAYKWLQEEVWPSLKPEWSTANIIAEPLTAGFTNKLNIYRSSDDEDKKHAVVVRLLSPSTQEKRDIEFLKMQVAEQVDCYPTQRAVLPNGFIYDYAPGRMLEIRDLVNTTIAKKVASAIAAFHWTDTSAQGKFINMRGEQMTFEVRDMFLEITKSALDEVEPHEGETEEDRTKRDAMVESVKNELGFVEDFLSGLELPVANTHNDFHIRNILFDEGSGRVTLLDFEGSMYGNFAMFDLAYLFHLCRLDKAAFPAELDSNEMKHIWIKSYLERKYQVQGQDASTICQTEVDLWTSYLEIMQVLAPFQHGARIMKILGRNIGRSVMGLAEFNMDFYFSRKSGLEALKQRCLELRAKLASPSAKSVKKCTML